MMRRLAEVIPVEILRAEGGENPIRSVETLPPAGPWDGETLYVGMGEPVAPYVEKGEPAVPIMGENASREEPKGFGGLEQAVGTETLQNFIAGGGPDFLLLTSPPAPSFEKACGIALVSPKDVLAASLFIQKEIEKASAASMDSLFSLINASAGSRSQQVSLNNIARMLGNPLIFIDQNMQVVAWSDHFEIADPAWEESIRLGQCSEEFLHMRNIYEKRTAIGQNLTKNVRYPGDAYAKLIAPFYTCGHLACELIMIEQQTPVTDRHVQFLPLICKLLYMMYNHGESEYGQDALSRHCSVLCKLLDEEDNHETLHHIYISDFNFPAAARVVVARLMKRAESRFARRALMLQLKKIFPEGDVLQRKGYVVALISADGQDARVSESLRGLAAQEDACIGVSWLLNDISQFKVHYNQAMACVKLSESFGLGKGLYEYDNFFFFDLLDHCGMETSLEHYIMREIKVVKDQDQKNSGCLEHTLRVFLDNDGNAHASSRSLYIHRNTLLYRLRHIEKLTGLDLNNPVVRTQLRTSMAIDRFLHRHISRYVKPEPVAISAAHR